MKNRLFLLVFLGAVLPLQAQMDTLGKYPHLYYYQMPELGDHDGMTCNIKSQLLWVENVYMGPCADEIAHYMHSDDTIQIVGIAFASGEWMIWNIDSSDGHVNLPYNILRLYDSSMTLLDSTRVLAARPVPLDSNYLPIFIPNLMYMDPGYRGDTLALRLVFFDDSIAISGGFYLGIALEQYNSLGCWFYSGRILHLYEDHPEPYAFPAYHYRIHDRCLKEWYDYEGDDLRWFSHTVPLFFPILSSYCHSNNNTNGIAESTAADRHVALSPNPATGRVQVTAECGMTEVSVYNAAGEQVYRQPASGHSATVDTGRWPSGVYVVHIETPLGQAVKKLVVN